MQISIFDDNLEDYVKREEIDVESKLLPMAVMTMAIGIITIGLAFVVNDSLDAFVLIGGVMLWLRVLRLIVVGRSPKNQVPAGNQESS